MSLEMKQVRSFTPEAYDAIIDQIRLEYASFIENSEPGFSYADFEIIYPTEFCDLHLFGEIEVEHKYDQGDYLTAPYTEINTSFTVSGWECKDELGYVIETDFDPKTLEQWK